MVTHPGKRLFITGIPTAGKSYLANKIAQKVNGIAVSIDDFREEIASDERYKKWINFYLNQDENIYLTKTDPDTLWQNLVNQSESLWPALAKKIHSYHLEEKPVIFESVNILPHLARRDFEFSGLVLIGSSYQEVLKRNIENPRWGKTKELQKLEAKIFFAIERPRYKAEAEKYGYSIFETADLAFEPALKLLSE